MTRTAFLAAVLALGGLVAAGPVVQARSAAPAQSNAAAQDHQQHHPQAAAAPDAKVSGAQMMNMQHQMMAEMKASDGRIDALVTRMNAASGSAKVDAIADLLTALVQQHRTMRDGMMNMQGQMMGQMMQHMSGGSAQSNK